ncbi:hypothetical protein LH128_17127 [Sphingomonas sp. LH128]|uniref:Ca2+-dependent phosphoinositide-specific phospholipase C n=1 Tax=Sphingomonas sp. LH128 TaxID=473781 RepID=UPI00027C9793|nr:Ca2+-dependent phosphoinositide-specific phospholipase C [Sphingomonas sp. LH128]EJU11792.1 hypothetical protein LH128_17127 [Sphingomonas sp. LH128]
MADITEVGTHNTYKAATSPETIARLRQQSEKAAMAKDYAHRPVKDQLEAGARAFEFDVNYDPEGGHFARISADPRLQKPGFKVMHIPGIDDNTNCLLLVECLRDIRIWSDAHPDHAPILIMFNSMDEQNAASGGFDALPFNEAAYDALDREVLAVFGPEKIITPAQVQGTYATLRDAVLAHNWPGLDKARGKVFCSATITESGALPQ